MLGIAVDWLRDKVYWTAYSDKGDDVKLRACLIVSTLDGRFVISLFSSC